MSNLLKNLLFALGLSLLLWLGYWLFLKDDSDAPVYSGEEASGEAIQKTQEFVARLNELESRQIDVKIISDARFASLYNFRQEIGTEPTGRTNPFAPLE